MFHELFNTGWIFVLFIPAWLVLGGCIWEYWQRG